MKAILVLMPVHLFPDIDDECCSDTVLVEDPGFFYGPTGDFSIHKGRQAWLRAACDSYCRSRNIRRVSLEESEAYVSKLAKDKSVSIRMTDPLDNGVADRWRGAFGKRLQILEGHRGFVINKPSDYSGNLVMKSVLEHCQKETGILVGVKSTDEQNRKPPDDSFAERVAEMNKLRSRHGGSSEIKDAKRWAEKTFPNNPGEVSACEMFPHTRKGALSALKTFVKHALPGYGAYQDAVLSGESIMLHSGLAACMNAGLISPLECARAAAGADVDLQNSEAYVRQLLGWREYMRLLYGEHGRYLEKKYFGKYPRLGGAWYDGSDALTPLSSAVSSAEKHAYLDHIQRLMVANNLGILAGAHPGGVMRWFTELVAIDAHQWAMIGNIAHMSAMSVPAGGKLKPLARRAYISSSSYIRRMTDHGSGDWEEEWDALYYAYLKKGEARSKFYASALRGKKYTQNKAGWEKTARSVLRRLEKK